MAVGGWVEGWVHCRGCGTVLRLDVATYVDTHFVCCTKEESYASCLALIVRNGSELTDAAPITHALEYVALSRP